jgi:hypothetical protein
VRLQGTTSKRLDGVRQELARAREALRILDEQVAFAEDVAADATTRALVAGTPLADRDRHGADEDLRRARRERDDLAARISELTAEQDLLLERLLEERR